MARTMRVEADVRVELPMEVTDEEAAEAGLQTVMGLFCNMGGWRAQKAHVACRKAVSEYTLGGGEYTVAVVKGA